MIRYLIFRHGEAETENGSSSIKSPLTKRGIQQAEKLGIRLTNFNVAGFYSSPIQRARQTAEIVNKYLGIPIQIEDRLQEVGTYRMYHEVLHKKDIDGMTLEDFNKAQLGIVSFLSEQKEKNDENTVLVSTHGNLIKAMLAITVGITDNDALNRLIIGNTGLTVLEWLKDDDYQLVVFNDTNHLGELIFR